MDDSSNQNSQTDIIPGLSFDLAALCLARVPRVHYFSLSLVSRSWHQLLRSQQIYRIRKNIGVTEMFICASRSRQSDNWLMYFPGNERWVSIPRMPLKVKTIAFYGVASINADLYVIGGIPTRHNFIFSYVATNRVWIYNAVSNCWRVGPAMIDARSSFACSVINGRIYVAGGLNGINPISRAEVFDPSIGIWQPISDMHLPRTSSSSFVIRDRFYVCQSDKGSIEAYDINSNSWTLMHRFDVEGEIVAIKNRVYFITQHAIQNIDLESWTLSDAISCVPTKHAKSLIYAKGLVTLGKELVIIEPSVNCHNSTCEIHVWDSTTDVWSKMDPIVVGRGDICGLAILEF